MPVYFRQGPKCLFNSDKVHWKPQTSHKVACWNTDFTGNYLEFHGNLLETNPKEKLSHGTHLRSGSASQTLPS